ncbi:hypothetical protein [Micromonospora sp. NPDC005707]|uniref:hypothetical protein n=1 Tax=Micromonospora sp. NPDC005707 TaxID=3157050 RepID=UPI0033C98325
MPNLHSDDARAAARLVGIPIQATPAGQGELLLRGTVTESGWRSLAGLIIDATRIWVVGVMPQPLVEALQREVEAMAEPRLPDIEYYTPRSELALNLGRELHCYVNRWQAGYMGLRNLVNAAHGQRARGELARVEHRHFGTGISALSFNCLLHVVVNDGPARSIMLSELLEDGDHPDHIAQVLPSSDAGLNDYLERLRRDGKPIRLREVRCRGMENPTSGEVEPDRLRIGELVPLGGVSRNPNLLRPISIVVVRCHSPAGLEVLLKRRTPLTDTDDFGKLSLLSARVQEVDVASALGATVSPSEESDIAALEDLWLAAGSPHPFVLPAEAFRLAARREVSLTLGLHVELDRFERKGFHLVQHESESVQLAFMVFTLDLVRSGQLDELRVALSRGPNLVRVLAPDLYNDEGQLNRLLRQRRKWLTKACFSDDSEVLDDSSGH